MIPPAGGTAPRSLRRRGNTTELRQYQSSTCFRRYLTTTYTYDRASRLTKLTDTAGNKWTWTYDLRGRKLTATDPGLRHHHDTYDDAGNLLTTKDGRGVTLAYVYDPLGRRTDRHLYHAPRHAAGPLGLRHARQGPARRPIDYRGSDQYKPTSPATTTPTAPWARRLPIPASAGTALAGDWTTTTSYNVDGSTASIGYPAAGGLGAETVNYTYDANGYNLTAAGLDTYVSATSYQPWGDVYQRTLGSGSTRARLTTDEYSDTHRLKTISASPNTLVRLGRSMSSSPSSTTGRTPATSPPSTVSTPVPPPTRNASPTTI